MNGENHALKSINMVPGEAEDYSKILNRLLASSHAGRGQIWPRGQLILPHKQTYFKPDTNLYRDTLKKDRRNGKKLEHIHSAGTWIGQALAASQLFISEAEPGAQGRLFYITRECLLASKDILGMRTSNFQAILPKGPAVARQVVDLVEAKVEVQHSQVASTAYADIYSELSAKYVIQAAKEIAKNETETTENKRPDGTQGGGKNK